MNDRAQIRIAEPGERTRALRRARINSIFVRLMRWSLPVGAVALLGCYGLFMQRTIIVDTGEHKGQLHTGTVSTDLDNLAMTNPSYEGYNKKNGSRYRVSAAKAITDLSRDKPIKLVDIAGTFEQASGSRTAIEATNGLFDQELGILRLGDGIKVDAPDGMRVFMNSAKVDTRKARITSQQAVKVMMPGAEVRGNSMMLDQKARSIVFDQGVAARFERNPKTDTTKALQTSKDTASNSGAGNPSVKPNNPQVRLATQASPGATALRLGGNANAPVDITAQTLSISEKERTALFTGNVRAFQDGATLEAPELVVSFSGGGGALGVLGGKREAGSATPKATGRGQLRQIVARNGVLVRQDGNVMRARTAIFNPATNKAEMIGNVRISAPGQQTIEANSATIDTATNEVALTGQVVARQTDSLLRGTRLVFRPNEGRLRLTAPSRQTRPAGSIFVRFRPPQRGPARKQRQAPTGGLTFSTNPDAPIEITARALDVRDLNSTAQFDGDVTARQGDLVLKAPILTAEYQGRLGLRPNSENATSRRGDAIKLRVIRATGPVVVTSGDDARASGERAIFDMVASKVTLSGNVVVKRGRQIIRGERLIIDLKTGLSVMKNADPERNQRKPLAFGAAPKITANPARRDCGGQMCAVFYPQDAERGAQARKTKDRRRRNTKTQRTRPAPRINQGWSTSTSPQSTN